jgi:hypothetical protein
MNQANEEMPGNVVFQDFQFDDGKLGAGHVHQRSCGAQVPASRQRNRSGSRLVFG